MRVRIQTAAQAIDGGFNSFLNVRRKLKEIRVELVEINLKSGLQTFASGWRTRE